MGILIFIILLFIFNRQSFYSHFESQGYIFIETVKHYSQYK